MPETGERRTSAFGERYVWIEDRRGTRLPYSKSVQASSMMVVGILPETAFHIAALVEDELRSEGRRHLPVEELVERVVQAITDSTDSAVAARYAAWVRARRLGWPLLVLLGGATGSGKSTIAARLAARLGVAGVVSSDGVREVMRGMLPTDRYPALHVSAFEAFRVVDDLAGGREALVTAGFRRQAELVADGIRRLVDRAAREASSLVVEGIHIVPGVAPEDVAGWAERMTVCQAVMAVPEESTHRAHFLTRLERAPDRKPQRYLDHFEEIRMVQADILRVAEERGIRVISGTEIDENVQTLTAMIVDEMILAASER